MESQKKPQQQQPQATSSASMPELNMSGMGMTKTPVKSDGEAKVCFGVL